MISQMPPVWFIQDLIGFTQYWHWVHNVELFLKVANGELKFLNLDPTSDTILLGKADISVHNPRFD